jgi:hypothetical protein
MLHTDQNIMENKKATAFFIKGQENMPQCKKNLFLKFR